MPGPGRRWWRRSAASSAIFDLVPGAREVMTRWDRATGLFKDPNVFGPFLVPALVYALSRLAGAPLRRSLVPLGVLPILALASIAELLAGSLGQPGPRRGDLRFASPPHGAPRARAAEVRRAGASRHAAVAATWSWSPCSSTRSPACSRSGRPDAELRRGAGRAASAARRRRPASSSSIRSASARSSSCRSYHMRSRTTSIWRCSSTPAGSAGSCSSG